MTNSLWPPSPLKAPRSRGPQGMKLGDIALTDIPAPGEWVSEGACRGMGWEIFFPKERYARALEAKAVCAKCPVLESCRDYGLAHNSRRLLGVWGGLTQSERDQLRRKAS